MKGRKRRKMGVMADMQRLEGEKGSDGRYVEREKGSDGRYVEREKGSDVRWDMQNQIKETPDECLKVGKPNFMMLGVTSHK